MKNDSHKISIIMPCYNCKDTVEEALQSVYVQNLTIPFEVVMVDDGSTDGTKDFIISLSKKYSNVRCFFHDKNRGGGAARNTAVEHATGDLIFCLDSDDLLTPGMLQKMVDYLDEKKSDAVGISKSIQFNGKDVNNVSYIVDFDYIGRRIPFDNLFGEKTQCSLYSTFLHTKESFYVAGGYPTDHGFDTQGFAFRFLANGLEACVCPDTVYLHRVNYNKSYYIREHESGKISHNWFKIYEEFLFLFNDKMKNLIINYDLNDYTSPIASVVNKESDLFIKNYNSLIRTNSKEVYKRECLESKDKCNKFDYYWLGSEEYRNRLYSKAVDYFVPALTLGVDSEKLYYKIFDSLCKINNLRYEDVADKVNNFKKLNKVKFNKSIYCCFQLPQSITTGIFFSLAIFAHSKANSG